MSVGMETLSIKAFFEKQHLKYIVRLRGGSRISGKGVGTNLINYIVPLHGAIYLIKRFYV